MIKKREFSVNGNTQKFIFLNYNNGSFIQRKDMIIMSFSKMAEMHTDLIELENMHPFSVAHFKFYSILHIFSICLTDIKNKCHPQTKKKKKKTVNTGPGLRHFIILFKTEKRNRQNATFMNTLFLIVCLRTYSYFELSIR